MPSSRISIPVILISLAWAAGAAAQPAPQAGAPPAEATTPYVRNWTRASFWNFFEPPPGGGNNDYADLANRLQVGIRRTARRYEAVAAVQYVQFGGLPSDAVGPGPLGLGSIYFAHAGRSDSRQVYLRYLNLRLKELAPGLAVTVGRMGYTSGAESVSGDAKIEAVKRQRLDSRMLGEFEWAIYQRGYDGARVDYQAATWSVTGAAFRPTQGGFEDAAGATIDDIDVFAATVALKPGAAIRRTELQAFAYRYGDDREVRARPDNTGRAAARVDVGITSVGTALTGAYPAGSGQWDALAWVVGQTGHWYDEPHRAYSVAAEAGYQWTGAPWRPWVRGGLLRASGDDDPADGRHHTFFQMLPTVRKYSLTATYSQMNLTDAFGQVFLRPTTKLNLRGDVHRVGLASARDRWYFGSGATQERGTLFGYSTRPSNGASGLGTVIEGSADYAAHRHFSVNGYVGAIRGGDVVRRAFEGRWLTFAYLETVVQF